jgi:hypothetical protein
LDGALGLVEGVMLRARSLTKEKPMRALNRRRVSVVEALEGRTMLNGADGPIVINGTDGPDVIQVYYSMLADWNWTYNYSVNGVGKGLYDFDASKIVINGKGGDDKITVYSLPYVATTIMGGDGNDQIELPGVAQICGTYVDGGTGNNTLRCGMDKSFSIENYDPVFIDSYDVTSTSLQKTWYDTQTTITYPEPPITYSNLQSITFQTSPADVKVNVHSTAANCTTTIFGGPGKNTFTVGDMNLDANLQGHLSLLGQGGVDTVTFNDLVDTGNDTYTLNAASLSKPGMGGADFYDIENINLIANGGNDTIYVNAVSSFATVNVSGSGGNDSFYIGNRNYAGNISGKLNIGGGSGNNQVQFNDQDDLGADVYTMGNGVFTKTGLKYPTTFSGVQIASIAANMDPNTFEITPSSATRFVAYGRGPGFVGNGDVLHLHVDGVTSPSRTTTFSGVGYYRFGNRLPVSFNGVETTVMVGTPVTLTTMRVNAGGGAYTDSSQQAWSADSGFAGGVAKIDNVPIAGTTDDALYASRRVGSNMTFSAPVVNGTYTVRLLMADPFFAVAGQRVFDVFAEGVKVLAGVDIAKEVGAKTALVKTFVVTVTDGRLDLQFKSSVDNATISGIEVTPALLS